MSETSTASALLGLAEKSSFLYASSCMKMRKEPEGTIIISLERGDLLRASIERVAAENGIGCAEISAVGAVEDPELGYYDLDDKAYMRRIFPGRWELLTCDGNITLKDGKPFLHAHPTIAGRDFRAFGGHLFDASVAVVVELFMRPHAAPLKRIMCDEIGLPRWEPND
jgi:hypothetical protein